MEGTIEQRLTAVDLDSVKDEVITIPKSPPNSSAKKQQECTTPVEFRCPYPDCVFKSRYDFNFARHLKTHKKHGTFAYTCSGCKGKFSTSMTLGRHKRSCAGASSGFSASKNPHVVAPGSESSCSFQNALEKVKPEIANLPSIIQLPNGTEFGCSACDYVSKIKFNVKKHLLSHGDEKPFKCTWCHYRSKWEGNVRAHEKKLHFRVAQIRARKPKKRGPKTSKIPQIIPQLVPPPPPPPESSILLNYLKSEPQRSNLSEPALTSERRPSVTSMDSKDGLFECTECDYKSTNRRLLISHLKIHSDERPFPCHFPGCSYRTKWSHWARAHERKVHNGWVRPSGSSSPSKSPPHKPRKSPSKQVTVAAPKSPPPPLPLPELPLDLPDVKGYKYDEKAPCPHCGLKVLARFLHRHILVHTNLKPYGCSFCSYRSRWPGDVKTHEQRLHANQPRPKGAKKVEQNSKNRYKCSECDYRGLTSWHVSRHKMIHGDVWPYSCSWPKCRFKARELYNLKSHEERLHGSTVFQNLGINAAGDTDEDSGKDCRFCGYLARLGFYVRKHMKGCPRCKKSVDQAGPGDPKPTGEHAGVTGIASVQQELAPQDLKLNLPVSKSASEPVKISPEVSQQAAEHVQLSAAVDDVQMNVGASTVPEDVKLAAEPVKLKSQDVKPASENPVHTATNFANLATEDEKQAPEDPSATSEELDPAAEDPNVNPEDAKPTPGDSSLTSADPGLTSEDLKPFPEVLRHAPEHLSPPPPPSPEDSKFTPAEPTSAIPPESTFACMLCPFVGTTQDAAVVHAAHHNITEHAITSPNRNN